MKPVSYVGKHHSNMTEVVKWSNSSPSGVKRRTSRRCHATIVAAKKLTKKRARAISKRMIAEFF
jgi:hypothetical protein